MLKQLINLFIRQNGRSPNAIEMLQLKFKAAQQSGKGQVIQFPRDRITDWRKTGPGEGKVSELQSGIMKATESKPTVVKTEAQIKSKLEAGNKAAVQKMKIDKLRKDVLKEIENRKNEDYIGNIIDPEDYGFRVSDGTLTDEVEEIMEMLIRDKKAYGGVAGMLGEPTYTDENHRVPLDNGGMTLDEVADDVKLDNFIKNLDFIELMRKIPEGTSLDTIDDIKRRLNYERGISVAEGGRVPLSKGKTVKGLAALMDEFFPGTTKLGQTSKSMAPKTQLRQAIAGFQEREKAAKFKEMIKNKYQGRIDDDLLNKILVDDNPQRIAEVLATIDEALLMQGKGMGPDEIINTFKESWKRKPHASGGVAGMLGE